MREQGRTAPPVNETEFEKPRGVRRVEVRSGFAQAHVSDLDEPVTASRIRVLEAVAEAGVSLDFLKLTPGGLSFLVKEEDSTALESALRGLRVRCTVQSDRRVVLVHAVNIRDEEGLVAGILMRAIGSGARIDHVSDMHDRMLLVMGRDDAERVREALEGSLAGARA